MGIKAKWKILLKDTKFSKKLTLAISSVVCLILTDILGLNISMESTVGIVSIVVGYTMGQSYVDSKKEQNNGK